MNHRAGVKKSRKEADFVHLKIFSVSFSKFLHFENQPQLDFLLFLLAPPCYDKDELCSEFARDGMCMLEPAYMTQFCQKSCDFCIKRK